MRSLKHQILFLMLGSLVVLGACFILVFGWQMRQRALDAAIVKTKSDLATRWKLSILRSLVLGTSKTEFFSKEIVRFLIAPTLSIALQS